MNFNLISDFESIATTWLSYSRHPFFFLNTVSISINSCNKCSWKRNMQWVTFCFNSRYMFILYDIYLYYLKAVYISQSHNTISEHSIFDLRVSRWCKIAIKLIEYHFIIYVCTLKLIFMLQFVTQWKEKNNELSLDFDGGIW